MMMHAGPSVTSLAGAVVAVAVAGSPAIMWQWCAVRSCQGIRGASDGVYMGCNTHHTDNNGSGEY